MLAATFPQPPTTFEVDLVRLAPPRCAALPACVHRRSRGVADRAAPQALWVTAGGSVVNQSSLSLASESLRSYCLNYLTVVSFSSYPSLMGRGYPGLAAALVSQDASYTIARMVGSELTGTNDFITALQDDLPGLLPPGLSGARRPPACLVLLPLCTLS